MNPKTLLIIICLLAITTGCKTADKGVVINGVKWATRNVDVPGTFANKPEDAGMFYQWNKKYAWNTTDKEITGWDKIPTTSTEWIKDNDPSPKGWRVPNREEMLTLFDDAKVTSEWIIQNAISGMRFTDIESGYTVFFPAVNFRGYINGILLNSYSSGHYWANAHYISDYDHELSAYRLSIEEGSKDWSRTSPYFGFSVCCVAK